MNVVSCVSVECLALKPYCHLSRMDCDSRRFVMLLTI